MHYLANHSCYCPIILCLSQLERLAEGLSHEQNVRVVAVNGDSPEGRIFSREVSRGMWESDAAEGCKDRSYRAWIQS